MEVVDADEGPSLLLCGGGEAAVCGVDLWMVAAMEGAKTGSGKFKKIHANRNETSMDRYLCKYS